MKNEMIMGREIKFRVWWRKQMRYNAIVGNGQAIFIPNATDEYKWVSLIECTSMQFTGLSDTNKKDVYEGDIVSYGNRLFVVEPNLDGYHLQRYKLWRGKFEKSFRYSLSLVTKKNGKVENIEIVGNIYENPDFVNINSKYPYD